MAARWMIWGAGLSFLADQASKYLVIHWMGLDQRHRVDVLPPFLNFRYGENSGINFGLFGGGDEASRWILIGMSLAICLALVVWIARAQKASRGMAVSPFQMCFESSRLQLR